MRVHVLPELEWLPNTSHMIPVGLCEATKQARPRADVARPARVRTYVRSGPDPSSVRGEEGSEPLLGLRSGENVGV